MFKKCVFYLVFLMLFAVPLSAAAADQSIVVKTGFNFVSFTVTPEVTPSALKQNYPAIVDDIYMFSAAAGSFLSNSEGTLTSLAAGKGYIIKALSDGTIAMSGTAVSSVADISLKTGFNLIGMSQSVTAGTFSSLMKSFGIIKGLYKWSPAAGSFLQVVTDTAGTPQLLDGVDPAFKIGESYFINVYDNTTLSFAGGAISLIGGTVPVIPVTPSDIPASVLSDIPAAEQTPGAGDIAGEISIPTASPSLGADRVIVIKSLSNIKVWIKNHPEISTTTDENGKFTLKNAPAAPKSAGHTLEYEKVEGQDCFKGLIKDVPVVEKKKIDLKPYIGPAVIKLVGTIQGRLALMDGLSPLGADVYIPGISGMVAKVDEDGTFSMMYVPEGTFSLVFQFYGYEIIKKEVSVAANEVKQIDRVILKKITPASTVASVDGYIIGDDNIPVSGALVSIISSDSGSVDLGTISSATGHYEFKNLAPGSYKLIFTKDGYKGAETAFTLTAGQEKHSNQTLVRVPVSTGSGFGLIGGYIKDLKTDAPIRNAVVMTVPPTEQFFTDNNGFFSFLINPGEYTLIVKKAGYVEDRITLKAIEDIAIEVGGYLENLDTTAVETISLNLADITMKPGQSFQFIPTLKDASGNILFGRTVTWTSSGAAVGTVSPTGMFTAAGAGSCTVTAASGGKTAQANITVAAPEGALVSLKLTPVQVALKIGDVKRFSVTATCSDGQVRVIFPSLAQWTVPAQLSEIEKGAYMAQSAGTGEIGVSFGGASAKAQVAVGFVTGGDARAPIITHKIPVMMIGKSLNIKAYAADNVGVAGVWLFYRKTSGATYTKAPMAAIATEPGAYEYTIPAADVTAEGVQYYIYCEDTAAPAPNTAVFPAGAPAYPVSLKSYVPSKLTLSKTADKIATNTIYDLTTINASVDYADGTARVSVPLQWKITSGGGTLSNNFYTSSSTNETVVLGASYAEAGVTLTVTLTLTVEANPFVGEVPAGKGWTGKVYPFSSTLSMLPDFSKLGEPGTIFYAPKIDVPERSFDMGFPGFGKDIFENFAIRFTTKLLITEAKSYTFALYSDDGSKLYIDNHLVINNDGVHPSAKQSGSIYLTPGEHPAVVEYFQGPRYYISLQFYWNAGGTEALVPVENTVQWDGSKIPYALSLSKSADTVAAGTAYDLSKITVNAIYTDSSSVALAPAGLKWAVKQGAGSISGSSFTGDAAGTAVLTVTYSEGGSTRTAELTLTVTAGKTLTGITLSPATKEVAVDTLMDLKAIAVTARYSDNTTTAVDPASVTWTSKSGVGTVYNFQYSSLLAGPAVLTASYTESGTTVTADLAVTVTASSSANVIHSTTAGGDWASASTWVEKIVPAAANDVEINGPVVINAETPCNNLTIKNGGTLQNIGRGDPYGRTPTTVGGDLIIYQGGILTNEPGYRSRVVVKGNCAVNGLIKNSSAGVLLEVAKNFTLNGTCETPSLTFNGTAEQTITRMSGKFSGTINIANSLKAVKALSDIYFENVTVTMPSDAAQAYFDLNDNKLIISGGASALVCEDTSAHAPKTKFINVAGIDCADGAIIYESAFANANAPIAIGGTLTTVGRSGGGVQVNFEGDVTVAAGAVIRNEIGYRSGIAITGTLTNNGSVASQSGGVAVEVKKNLVQNGDYTAVSTTFNGAGVQNISLGASKKISGTVYIANQVDKIGSIKALSNITVENIVIAAFPGDATTSGVFDMNGYRLDVLGGASALVCDDTSNHVPRIEFINIAGVNCAEGAIIYESRFANSTAPIEITGSLTTVGRGAGGIQAYFNGGVTVAAGATLKNESGYRSGISITGSLVNNGSITSQPGGIAIEVGGSFTQNGDYTAISTAFKGSGEQGVSMAAGKKIPGNIYIANAANGGGAIKALSDIAIENVTISAAPGDTVSSSTVNMNGYKLLLMGGANALVCDDTSAHAPRVKFTNIAGITGSLLAEDPDPAKTVNPMIWESVFENASAPIVISGRLRTVGRGAGGVQVTFNGSVTVAPGAKWSNEPGYRSGVTVTGTFANNGTVQGDSAGLFINGMKY